MKNQKAKFECSTDATLIVALFAGKVSIKVSVRQKTPGEKDVVGCKDYFDLTDEAKAQQAFDTRVKEAVAAGWTLHAQTTTGVQTFTAVPPAPGKVAAVGGQTSQAPRAAARR